MLWPSCFGSGRRGTNIVFFFSSRRRHTRSLRDWSSDVCSSDLTKDARLAEGKALGGSALTALSGCVQVKGSGSNCVQSEIRNRVGLDATGSTYDGRWVVSTAQLSVSTSVPPVLDGTITVSGVAGKNTDAMSLAFFANAS